MAVVPDLDVIRVERLIHFLEKLVHDVRISIQEELGRVVVEIALAVEYWWCTMP